jgi:hypothetical protein
MGLDVGKLEGFQGKASAWFNCLTIASHGRTGAACVFYGCVATGVLHRVDRPLLIIRSQRAD